MSGAVRVSVVLPVRDGGCRLGAVLEAIAHQGEAPKGLEILAIDSGSSDGSLARLKRAGVRTLEIAAGEFDHGLTRNLGAREASGELVVFLSQDAVPAGPDFVRQLVAPLRRERRLAGAFARQQPRPEADPITRRDLAAWVAGGLQARTVFLPEREKLEALSPMERYRLCAFDDVAAAVRREVLLAHPFESTRFGEDVEWGQRVLGLGFGLAYVPEAVVVHSHPRRARELYRRNYLGHRLLMRLFGLRTIPDRRHLARACLGAVVSDLSTLGRERGSLLSRITAPGQAIAATYGQYRGAGDEILGRPYPGWAP